MIFSTKAFLVAGMASLISYGPWVPASEGKVTHTKYVYEDRAEEDLANQCIVTVDDMKVLINYYTDIHPDSYL